MAAGFHSLLWRKVTITCDCGTAREYEIGSKSGFAAVCDMCLTRMLFVERANKPDTWDEIVLPVADDFPEVRCFPRAGPYVMRGSRELNHWLERGSNEQRHWQQAPPTPHPSPVRPHQPAPPVTIPIPALRAKVRAARGAAATNDQFFGKARPPSWPSLPPDSPRGGRRIYRTASGSMMREMMDYYGDPRLAGAW